MMRTACLVVLGSLLAACGGGDQPAGSGAGAPAKPKVAFVTNCVAEFWTLAEHGVRAAQQEFDVDVSVHMPAAGTAEEQTRILDDVMAKGVRAWP